MGNTLPVSASPRAHLAQHSVSHGNRRCWFGWSMSPSLSLLPFPLDASSSPSSCVHLSRKQHSPVRFFLQILQTSIIPSSLSSPSISSPFVVLAALPGPCCISTALLKRQTHPLYYNPEMTQFGAGFSLFSWTTTQPKILQLIRAARCYHHKFPQPYGPREGENSGMSCSHKRVC